MTDAQTTFARATLEYDKDYERALLEAITRAIFELSTVSDANAIVIRTGEAAEALLTVLAGILAMSPSATRSPTAICQSIDDPGKRLRRQIAAVEVSEALQESMRRTFRGGDTGGNGQAVNRASQLRRTSRKVDCIDQALAALRADRSLHLQHRNGNARWSLSDGQSVTADVAAILTCSALVVPAGNALFSDMPGQTWRYVQ